MTEAQSDTRPIAFFWAIEPNTADAVQPDLPVLAAAPRETYPVDADLEEALGGLLELAGLHFDQQPRRQPTGDHQVGFTGSATAEELATSITRFAEHSGATGGLVIDASTDPLRITEVRGISTRTIVFVDDDGGEQLHVSTDAVTAALSTWLDGRS